MTATQINVPALRFSEFTDEWQVDNLEEIAKITSGGTPNRAKSSYWNGHIPWVSTTLIDFNTIFDSNEYITSEGVKNSSAKIFPKGTLLMAMYGQGKTRGKVAILGIEATTNQACAAIIPNPLVIQSIFLFQNLAGRYEEIRELSNLGGQENISGGIIKKISLSYPSLPEQQKIASFLTAIDAKIELLSKKKALLEQYKKGVMQQLFSQQIRFKNDEGNEFPEWEEKALGEVLDYEQPTKYLVSSTEYNDTYQTPVLTAGKTFILGYTNEQSGVFKHKLPVIIFDDFTTANKYVDFPFKAKSSAMKILHSKKGILLRFIYEAMQLIDYSIGGHERHWISKYSNLKIEVPSYIEQQKIVYFINGIDTKISTVRKQIEFTNAYKKGLLQQLFV